METPCESYTVYPRTKIVAMAYLRKNRTPGVKKSEPVIDQILSQVRAEREKRGYTQQTLSEKAAIDLKTLQAFERKARTPSLAALIRLIDALDLQIKLIKKR